MRAFRFIITTLLIMCAPSLWAQPVTIAVAANMKNAFAEINAAFRATGKSELRVVFGSSGNFTAQIMNGAPYSLLIAADEHFPLELYKSGKAVDEGTIYAIGKLAVIAKKSLNLSSAASKVDIAGAITKANKVAIAKPELAPYGKAAVQYLKSEGLWDLAKDKLIYADNIGVATMYVASGAADIGFSALSLAMSPELMKSTSYSTLNHSFYEPIKQRMVLMKNAPTEAVELYQFMQSAQAKSILHKYGYTTP
ncbi:molybdate ABC transporter substrate-binding protein [Polynucleobacter sp. 15G-AUS-farblos]|uniref:molybdate ABC transporter substrate-binding protein n=1 Tax=Polynucleobacter sp. 15G-AUS-farblos TaxID=2689094 RepID=UPI001C0CF82E|nr:molybdate ABC transporter substrate-binding protein [Polynucleobacter sp. 15G-AUS-farblos]